LILSNGFLNLLKHAIQTEYQLEDSELATESLPDKKNRLHLLIYEASEGGAGVLRQLVEDPESWGRVARTALYLCHFDPDTGADLGKAEHAEENARSPVTTACSLPISPIILLSIAT
jgi:hypothetical protein